MVNFYFVRAKVNDKRIHDQEEALASNLEQLKFFKNKW